MQTIKSNRFNVFISMLAILLLSGSHLLAQVPQGIPTENVETDWSSWSTWVMYVVLPLAILALYFIGKKRWKKTSDL